MKGERRKRLRPPQITNEKMLIISLIIFAIIAMIVAAVLGLLSSVVAWRIVRRRNWSHKRLIVLLAAITPALFIGMEAVLGLIGSVYISETKGADLGFGDNWEAPLSASHYLSAVDMPETACIREKGPYQEGSGRVEHLWVQDDSVFVTYKTRQSHRKSMIPPHPPIRCISFIVNAMGWIHF